MTIMKKLTPALLLLLSVAGVATAYHYQSEALPATPAGIPSSGSVTPEAKAAINEIAAKADNQHWKTQEERLDKSAKQIKEDTRIWMATLKKQNPNATEDHIKEDEDRMKKWEEDNFGKKE